MINITPIKKTPEFIALKFNYEKNAWHNETTYEHTLLILDEYTKYLKSNPLPFKKFKIADQSNYQVFKLVILLHDIAKPKTLELNEKNETKFPNHDKQGAKLAEVILKRFKYNKAIINYVKEIIKFHQKPHEYLFDRRNYQKMFEALKTQIPNTYNETVFFAMIDTMGSKLKVFNKEEYDFRMRKYQQLLTEIA